MTIVLAFGGIWTLYSRVPPTTANGSAPPASAREGFSAPDFKLDLLGGGQRALSELRGKVVIVNLWASWCPPCRAEMPALERMYQAYQNKGLEVLAVNSTFQDREADAAAFAHSFSLTFPILLDRTGSVSNRYLLRALPSTFFVDRRGVIRTVIIGGPMSEAVIQSKVEALLAELP
jgi:cytochrome c biogenesis protein CcmG/thiol:disulfide interchange protein DsbE